MIAYIIDGSEESFNKIDAQIKRLEFIELKRILIKDKDLFFDQVNHLKRIITRKDLVFINLQNPRFYTNQFTGKEDLIQEFKGIDVIKFLRIKEIYNHIICFANFSFEEIARKADNLVIASNGITYLHQSEMQRFSLEDKRYKAASRVNFSTYLKSAFIKPDAYHSWANWWGIYKLFNIQRIVEGKNIKVDEMEGFNETVLPQKFRNLESLTGIYLNKKAGKSEEEKLKSHVIRKKMLSHDIVELENVIQEFQEEVFKIKKNFNDLKSLEGNINALKKKGYINKAQKLFKRLKDRENDENFNFGKAFTTLENKKKISRISQILGKENLRKKSKDFLANQELIEQLILKDNSLPDLLISTDSKISELNPEKIRNDILTKKPKVLYIDDEAKKGWAIIFKKMIYGNSNPSNNKAEYPFFVEIPEKENFNKFFKSKVYPYLNKDEVDVILLDLRLFDEKNKSIDIENLSGYSLLEQIKNEFPYVPVMMVTASNKLWSLKRLLNLGVDAYWVKEGIESNFDLEDSWINYFSFLKQLNVLVSDDFQSLKSLGKKYRRLQEKGKKGAFWWENPGWKVSTPIDRKIIENILLDSLLIFQSYLQIEKMQRFKWQSKSQWAFPSLIIQNLFKIIEIIHGAYSKAGLHGDSDAIKLAEIRGGASHYTVSKGKGKKITINRITMSTASDFCDTIFDYLLKN